MPIISIAVLILLQRSILRIVYKKTDEWYIEWQQVVQGVVQRMTTSGTTSDHFTKHPKENSLNIEEDL